MRKTLGVNQQLQLRLVRMPVLLVAGLQHMPVVSADRSAAFDFKPFRGLNSMVMKQNNMHEPFMLPQQD